MVKYADARIVCLLVRVSEDPRHTDETIFDLMRPECVEDLSDLSKQNQLVIIIVGETPWTCIHADMPYLAANIGAHIGVALSGGRRWNTREFMAGVDAIRSLTQDPAALLDIFKRCQAIEILADR
jgi:hypothetical protein